jgi:hypothetical protein
MKEGINVQEITNVTSTTQRGSLYDPKNKTINKLLESNQVNTSNNGDDDNDWSFGKNKKNNKKNMKKYNKY